MAVEDHDRYRWLTVVAIGGVVAATVLAVVGLPSVDTHGPLHRWGVMGPTCGATRAAVFTARGELGLAWTYNPLGIAAVAGAGVMVLRAGWGTLTSKWPAWVWSPAPTTRRVLWGTAWLLVVLLEVRQQGRADLLMGP
ncbi:DUF2752 domain-containing protein [Phycicoccus sp. MAQZ13P-2]|uniref:DUF2752 domain-containing protein n=1 Tax=Phycicoccus mangrovi TaxID=2840470 RepID=UPI001BFFEA39|nr:DUF2752 domain-containing protein [Phycicoccus mangrovi]MBT9254605.1 DUF2752 domain-containing protein [Phycicoccus mangrovi]MBT9273190.1 DUF2752 domain-containing protein [Phycicoccus mangrovi]